VRGRRIGLGRVPFPGTLRPSSVRMKVEAELGLGVPRGGKVEAELGLGVPGGGKACRAGARRSRGWLIGPAFGDEEADG
jgi:hypothetical protein